METKRKIKVYVIKAHVWNSGNYTLFYYGGNGKWVGVDCKKEYLTKSYAERIMRNLQTKQYAADKVELELEEKEVDLCARELQMLVAAIRDDEHISKHIRKGTWISGSSTIVSPIGVWHESKEVRVQLTNGGRVPMKSAEKIKNRFKNLVSGVRFVKWDGSCPNELVFYLNYA